jgi:hypothetical protein
VEAENPEFLLYVPFNPDMWRQMNEKSKSSEKLSKI